MLTSTFDVKVPSLSALAHGAAGIVAASALCTIGVAVYRLILHPFARIPGPKLGACTDLWHVYQMARGRSRVMGETLHVQYGPIVRVAPNSLVFQSEEAFRAFYSAGSRYRKGMPFYFNNANVARMDWLGRRQVQPSFNLLDELRVKPYQKKRRLLGQLMGADNMLKYQHLFDEVLKVQVQRLKGLDGRAVDLSGWMLLMVTECLARVCYGEDINPDIIETDEISVEAGHSVWRSACMNCYTPFAWLNHAWPWAHNKIHALLGTATNRAPVPWVTIFKAIQETVPAQLKLEPSMRRDDLLLADMIRLHEAKPDEFDASGLRNWTAVLSGAGSDTGMAVMVGLFAALAIDKPLLTKAQQEIDECVGDPLDYNTMQSLTWVQACIKEGLRLNPGTTMPLFREVPETGDTVEGVYLPPGTIVGINSFSLALNPSIYGEHPEVFDPSRWLKSPEEAAHMSYVNLTFGAVNRHCPGYHLAMMLVRKLTVAIIQDFDVEIEGGRIPPEAINSSYFFAGHLSHLQARFIPRKEKSS